MNLIVRVVDEFNGVVMLPSLVYEVGLVVNFTKGVLINV